CSGLDMNGELRLDKNHFRICRDLSELIRGALALVSNTLFVFVGVLVRLLNESVDLFQILLFRQLVFVFLLLPAIVTSFDTLIKPRMVHWHLSRVLGAFAAIYLDFLTVSNIPLADATALGFAKVLFFAVVARALLSKAVDASRLFTLLVGFCGVMLMVRPSFADTSMLYTLTGLGSALGAAIAVISVRKMAATQSKIALLSYQAVFVGLIALIPSLTNWTWPSLDELILLLAVGVTSSIAQWIGITAYKLGEANVIVNVEYSNIIYSLVFGYWLFAEIPDGIAVIGMLVLFCSALLPLLTSHWKTRSGKQT
ncbi:DMT family transporter, partial [Aestuariirhabdus sp. Z084]|uniref:DMT family transporter n=1 Tax=Aestuariirhabdus haliotis TaxID=2918751 RepID=UPI00201B3E6B